VVVGVPLLRATGMVATRCIDGCDTRVLDSVDIALRAGDTVELRGSSGAGKTTLLLALARLLPGVQGTLELEGAPAATVPPEVWRTRVALLPQRTVLSDGTVGSNLRLPFTLKVREGVPAPADGDLRAALDGVGLADVSLERDARKLSVGQAARVALLRVLLAGPRALLLDEPDASLDDASAAAVAAMTARFAADGGAVLRVSHLRADAAATASYRLADGILEAVTVDAH
jgi:putative ABC transport system ATP-binding protein